jgi:hypothetical protein
MQFIFLKSFFIDLCKVLQGLKFGSKAFYPLKSSVFDHFFALLPSFYQ